MDKNKNNPLRNEHMFETPIVYLLHDDDMLHSYVCMYVMYVCNVCMYVMYVCNVCMYVMYVCM